MASKTDMLIAKALSTDSEDEAIACLKMARKQGSSLTTTATASSKNAEEWEALARKYHKIAYDNQENLKRVKTALKNALLYQTVHSAYNTVHANDMSKLKQQLAASKSKVNKWKMFCVVLLIFSVFLISVV